MRFDAQIVRSRRRTLAVEITCDGRVIVRAPQRLPLREIEQLLERKAQWIEDHLVRIAQRLPPLTDEERAQLLVKAREDLPRRVAHFAPLAAVSPGRITVRCQRTRWGSCSSKGNLNFNCLLMLCPEEVRDYVVVHELCHLKELNHSRRFWEEVAKVMPKDRRHMKWLKDHGGDVMSRIQ